MHKEKSMEIFDFSNAEYSNRNGSYGGAAGDKDGIVINGEPWIAKYPKSKDVINLFDAEQPRSNFFYLYAKMENRNYRVISALIKKLILFATDNYQR